MKALEVLLHIQMEGEEGIRSSQEIHDLESELFDAEASLAADEDRVAIPVPSAHIFNNIDEYFRKTFGKSRPLPSLQSSSGSKGPAFKRTLVLEECVPKHKRKELPTVLTKMKASIAGPNALLLKCLNKRIKVLIRRRKRVKLFSERFGWLSGVLVAFDKHLNLCVTDVDEKYQKCDQNNQTIDVCHHFRQLFIRGDNIVVVGFV